MQFPAIPPAEKDSENDSASTQEDAAEVAERIRKASAAYSSSNKGTPAKEVADDNILEQTYAKSKLKKVH